MIQYLCDRCQAPMPTPSGRSHAVTLAASAPRDVHGITPTSDVGTAIQIQASSDPCDTCLLVGVATILGASPHLAPALVTLLHRLAGIANGG